MSRIELLVVAFLLVALLAAAGATADTEWESYGNDPGGQRFVDLEGITRENVGSLEVAWTFHTGDVSDGKGDVEKKSGFEATPILVDGRLTFCSPFNRVFALEPATGQELWRFDPEIDLSARYRNNLVCRGVAHWRDPAAPSSSMAAGSPLPGACVSRIFTATNDARLIALDAASGRPCRDFGSDGEIDLNPAAAKQIRDGEYQVTSPPAIATSSSWGPRSPTTGGSTRRAASCAASTPGTAARCGRGTWRPPASTRGPKSAAPRATRSVRRTCGQR